MIERSTSIKQRGWSELRSRLWPQTSDDGHASEIAHICSNPDRLSAFVAYNDAAEPVGFVEAAARTDYVNGTSSSPVGFIEGIYVVPNARHRGVGRALVRAAEAWARTMGCREMASDARIENDAGHAFHRAVGFAETQRVVYFRKDLTVEALPSAGLTETMPTHSPEFMRYSAPDPGALARDIDGAREKLAEAIRVRDTVATVDHAADLGSMLTTARKEAEAIRLLQAHATLAEIHADHEASAWYWNALGTALQYSGHHVEAERHFAKATELSRAAGWSGILAMTLHHWGRSLAEQCRFDEAEDRFSEALRIRIEIGEPRQEKSRQALRVLAELRGGGNFIPRNGSADPN